MSHIDLFTGIGGFTLACHWNGIDTEVMCEKDERCQQFLEQAWPRIPIVSDALTLVKLCEEFVHIVGNERFLRVTPDVNLAIQLMSRNGETKTENSIAKSAGITIEEENNRLLTTMEGSVPVVGKLNWSSFALIINSITAKRKEGSITELRDGRLQSKEVSQTIIKSSATTATMQNRCTEYVLIKNPWILTAGVPCQPASRAGKQRGEKDNRWLWPTAIALVKYFNPTWCLFENPPGIYDVGIEGILSDLEGIGYETGIIEIPACAVGAPHIRQRVFILAHSTSIRRQRWVRQIALQEMGDTSIKALVAWHWSRGPFANWKKLMAKSKSCRMDDGISSTMDIRPRLHAYGNSIVPQVAYEIIKTIKEAHGRET